MDCPHPILSCDVSHTSYRHIRHLKRLQVRLCLVVPDLDLSIAIVIKVKSRKSARNSVSVLSFGMLWSFEGEALELN